MYTRKADLTHCDKETFFLWGSRQTGKSTLLRTAFPESHYIDLLNTSLFVKYSHNPSLLFDECEEVPPEKRIVIDEIQKVPALLDEVHRLIESRGRIFALCGSSARKVRRGHANLLGGRALRLELFGLVSCEVGNDFNLLRFLNHGVLPRHYQNASPGRLLKAYIADYLKEEVAAEGLVRNLPAFTDFLRSAAIGDTEIVNFENIARECGVAATTVRGYFEILEDTLLGSFLPAFSVKQKRRVIAAPKFYFRNVAVVNQLASRGSIARGSELFGKALENFIHHELLAYREYANADFPISYWRTSSGTEVDFILGNAEVAIEIKGVDRIREHHLRGLAAFFEDFPNTKQRIIVCLEPVARRLENGVRVLSVEKFLTELWAGSIL
jgi:predicted AAA+ superfamily ATPase